MRIFRVLLIPEGFGWRWKMRVRGDFEITGYALSISGCVRKAKDEARAIVGEDVEKIELDVRFA